MIELFQDRREHRFDIEEINDKSCRRIDCACHGDVHAIGMTVHTMATMRFRDFRQTMRRFKGKGLRDFHEVCIGER